MLRKTQSNRIKDIDALKANGIKAIIHKASEGLTILDQQYQPRRDLARANGLLWGAYHFGRPGSGVEQANKFLDHASPDASTLVALDLEGSATTGMPLPQAEEFVVRVHDKLGRWPLVYSSQSYLNRITKGVPSTVLTNCRLWVASYRDDSPRMPSAWPTWVLWQYTDGSAGPEPHSVPGVSSCDRNFYNGTENELTAFWGG